MKIIFSLLLAILSCCPRASNAQAPQPFSLMDEHDVETPEIAALHLDPAAEKIVNLALQRSPDIEKISARLVQAEADAGIAKAALLPNLAFTSGPTRSRNEIKGTATTAKEINFNTRQESTLSFRWELDLFGANRAQRRAAINEYDAARLELQAARIKLANTVRSEIVSYRSAVQRQILTRALVQTLENNLRMERALERAGILSSTDLNELESEVESSIASYQLLEIEARVLPLQLRTLTDVDTNTLQSLTEQVTPSCIAPHADGVPLTWLQQRLDVRTAQSRLLAATETAQSAQAALWPNISISADASKTRIDTGGVLNTITKSVDAFVLTQLAVTLFDGGRRRKIRDRTRADVDIAKAEFKTAVLLAAEETEAALISHQVQKLAASRSKSSSNAASLAYANSQLRQKAGIDSNLVLSRSQRQMLERKIESVTASRDHCISAINLNRAIALGEQHLYPTLIGESLK